MRGKFGTIRSLAETRCARRRQPLAPSVFVLGRSLSKPRRRLQPARERPPVATMRPGLHARTTSGNTAALRRPYTRLQQAQTASPRWRQMTLTRGGARYRANRRLGLELGPSHGAGIAPREVRLGLPLPHPPASSSPRHPKHDRSSATRRLACTPRNARRGSWRVLVAVSSPVVATLVAAVSAESSFPSRTRLPARGPPGRHVCPAVCDHVSI